MSFSVTKSEPPVMRLSPIDGERLPRIGLGTASHGVPLTRSELDLLRGLHLSYLRVDVRPGQADFPASLERATVDARALGVDLEVAIHLGTAPLDEIADLLAHLKRLRPWVRQWLVFADPPEGASEAVMDDVRGRLREYANRTPVAAGTDACFAELNRTRPSGGDMLCFSLNPQVHASDDASVMETLETLPDILRTAATFAGRRRLAVSPVTLRPRFNPDATGPTYETEPGELPYNVDPRQASLFGAAWTLGCLAGLAHHRVQSVTFYETTGCRGVMEQEHPPAVSESFSSAPGVVFPMYHVLADAGEFATANVVATSLDAPRLLRALALRSVGHTRVVVSNLTPRSQTVWVETAAAEVLIRVLDARSEREAAFSPQAFRENRELRRARSGAVEIALDPYATACVDWTD